MAQSDDRASEGDGMAGRLRPVRTLVATAAGVLLAGLATPVAVAAAPPGRRRRLAGPRDAGRRLERPRRAHRLRGWSSATARPPTAASSAFGAGGTGP